jgi:ribulose-phosphate 3-epimerase
MRLPPAGTIELAPSILSADFARLADEIDVVRLAGLKIVHLDVMDGHFVPNITIGPPVIAQLRRHSELVFDAHLMITEPGRYLDAFIEAGADHVTFHIECDVDSLALVERLHAAGCTAGICLNPETPARAVREVAPHCDMVLVMTVHPGFGGQKLIPAAAEKIAEIRDLVGDDVRIQVDGGIDETTAQGVVRYGADTLVAGNAIFGQPDRMAAVRTILAAAGAG